MDTRKIYRHLGYYNEIPDVRNLSCKSADEILDYYKHGYGRFYEDTNPDDCETHLDLSAEKENIESGNVKVTADGKFAIYDASWDTWKEEYKDKENGDESDCYIDIYEQIDLNDNETLPYNATPTEEIIEVRVSEVSYPIVYARKMQELTKQGMSEKEAHDFIRSTPFVLELYYDIDRGLFAVESEAVGSTPICSPYNGKTLV